MPTDNNTNLGFTPCFWLILRYTHGLYGKVLSRSRALSYSKNTTENLFTTENAEISNDFWKRRTRLYFSYYKRAFFIKALKYQRFGNVRIIICWHNIGNNFFIHFSHSRSRFFARNDSSSINSAGEIPNPSASKIIVFKEIPLVRLCIMLFIVGNGIPLNCASLYWVRFFSPIYLYSLSTTASLSVFIYYLSSITLIKFYPTSHKNIGWYVIQKIDTSSYVFYNY